MIERAEPALYHARRCLEICEANGIGDFDLAFAYEALARASAVAGDGEAARGYVDLARTARDGIVEDEGDAGGGHRSTPTIRAFPADVN